jgi:hypothetical protein
MRKDHLIEGLYDVIIRFGDIDKYLTENFYAILHAWYMTKTWDKFAFSGGWAEQPIDYIEGITAIESVYNEMEAEEMDKRMQESKSKR